MEVKTFFLFRKLSVPKFIRTYIAYTRHKRQAIFSSRMKCEVNYFTKIYNRAIIEAKWNGAVTQFSLCDVTRTCTSAPSCVFWLAKETRLPMRDCRPPDYRAVFWPYSFQKCRWCWIYYIPNLIVILTSIEFRHLSHCPTNIINDRQKSYISLQKSSRIAGSSRIKTPHRNHDT